ncbi:MAG: hypothetical protein LBP75_08865 [Planctomycetota bacterium]|jgi:hypothetical protein|nr:hypothetical protein [Planctomycetota bacterium]
MDALVLEAKPIRENLCARTAAEKHDDGARSRPRYGASGLLGIAAGSSLTVEKFLAYKREENFY